DMEGYAHGHGWGVADYPNGVPMIEKQTWAAFHGEHFSKKAARIYARTVVAHVRRATVGGTAFENTHPFDHGKWIFAHNGTVPNFDLVREKMLDHLDPLHRVEIRGSTDSEHVFRYLMSLFLQHPERGLLETVRSGLRQVIGWAHEIEPDARVGLNIILTDGEHMVGSCYNRTLFTLHRDHVFTCPICEKPHVHHNPKTSYKAIEIASEPITKEDAWQPVPQGTVFQVLPDYTLHFEDL
ncbi:MAG: class II glutamine amidotransferase, partial [Litoreibacter sp.]|nr:class II glutamine amidotransferase [Litoreibacter sp.]